MSTARKIDRHTFDMVPKALTSRPQWVVWKYARRDGKATKIPYQAASTNELAASNNPATWATFEQAVAAFRDNDDVDGIGYVFAADDPFIGIDFDKCRNAHGGFLPWAERWITELGGYQEISPSGVGIKAWIRASHLIDRHKVSKLGDGSGAIEVYDQTRFFTVTGQCVGLDTLTDDRSTTFARLYGEWFPPKAAKAKTEDRPPLIPMLPDDQTLLEKARTASNGSKFRDLYDSGNWQSHYGSQSEADLGLCQLLVFWCGIDPERIDRLFRTSAMFRAKWDGKRRDSTYGEWTIDRAISQASEFYTPSLPDPVEMFRGKRTATPRHSKSSNIDETEPKSAEREISVNTAGIAGSVRDLKIEWEPPLVHEGMTSPGFPLKVLPPALRDFVKQAAASIQCPIDNLAVPMIGVAAGAIGMSVNVRLSRTYVQSPGLYMFVVGQPGTRKSPPLHLAAKPAFMIDRANLDFYRQEKEEYERDVAKWESNKKGDRGDAPQPPSLVSLTIDDATREAVGTILGKNPRGVLMIRDEGTSLTATLNAYKGGKGDDKQFYLKVFSNSAVRIDRKGNPNDPIVILRPCLTIIACITPETLPALRNEKADDGWLDRMLFSYPQPVSAPEWCEDDVDERLLEEWANVVERLWQTPREMKDGYERPHEVQFTPDAWIVWKAWIKKHRAEQSAKDFPKSLVGPWSKYESICARFALILSRIHQASDSTYSPTRHKPRDIEGIDVNNAITLIDYFKAHFKKTREEFVGSFEHGKDDGPAILAWLRRSLNAPTELGELLRSEPPESRYITMRHISRGLPWWGSERQAAALSWLERRGYIQRFKVSREGPGRPHSDVLVLSPFIWDSESTDEPAIPAVLTQIEPEQPSAPALAIGVDQVRAAHEACQALAGMLWDAPRSREQVMEQAARSGLDPALIEAAASVLSVIRKDVDGVETWEFVR